MTQDSRKGGNGSTGPAMPALEANLGPPTLPLDQIVYMMKELEDAHRLLDALNLPPGKLSDRLVARARRWLEKVPGGLFSQTHPAVESRKIIQAAGKSVWQPPSKRGNGTSKGGKTDD